jgi:cytochrome c oxidase subunit 4
MAEISVEVEHGDLSPARYAFIYVGLLILTVATYLLSRLSLGTWSLVIALVIAVAKASLVVLFFMQLWQHHGSARLALAIALLWLSLLTFFVVADVKTRFPLANPSENPMLDQAAWAPAPDGSPTEPSPSGRPHEKVPP